MYKKITLKSFLILSLLLFTLLTNSCADNTNYIAKFVITPPASVGIGKFDISVTPPESECILKRNGVQKYRWVGSKIIDTVYEGKYDLFVSSTGYTTYNKAIVINDRQNKCRNSFTAL